MSRLLEQEKEKNRNKACAKLSIFSAPGTEVPDSEVVEQASGSAAARYVATLVDGCGSLADLTAGLGVNSYYFSRNAKEVYAVELNLERARCLEANFLHEKILNVRVVCADCIDWLKGFDGQIDVLYADPSRRNNTGRVISLANYSPDVKDIIETVQSRPELKAERLLVKTSPLLDIHAALNYLEGIAGFYIIENAGEVKELLIDIGFGSRDFANEKDIFLKCVRLKEGLPPQVLEFNIEGKEEHPVEYLHGTQELEAGSYVYEPSPSLMKAALWGQFASRFPEMKKLDRDTHLFHSGALYKDFPGRKFRIEKLLGSSGLKEIKGASFNVSCRNHPARPADIEKRFRLRPSDTRCLIATRVNGEKTIIQTEQIFCS